MLAGLSRSYKISKNGFNISIACGALTLDWLVIISIIINLLQKI